MNTNKFRQISKEELDKGVPVWLAGKSFLDTSPIPVDGQYRYGNSPVCGPYLIDRILFMDTHGRAEARVDLIDPGTGERRTMMRSWLLVPRGVYPWK